jgi:mersacidin/lichenicidin family type 2 lantibiotic
MSRRKIIRAWKDEEYRLGLSEAERALLPAHPAGLIELTDAELGAVVGGLMTQGGHVFSSICSGPISCGC